MTFDEIMQRLLDRVPVTFDKREGSVIYDALAPAARELYLAYEEMEEKRRNTFAGTADRAGLIECCAEIGLTPNPATYAVRQAIFTPLDLEVAIGERFNFEDLNFVVTKKSSPGVYEVTCETLGSAGNYGTGTLIPINYVQGLQTATLTDTVLIYGEDEEPTEELRQRYFDTLPTFTIDGNIAQYRKWCKNYPGIGKFKIFPCWNGRNTVKVSILSTENTAASNTLINEYQTYLDPATAAINDNTAASDYPQGRGLGNGQAPIGAIVTVSTATKKPLTIAAQLILREGYTAPVGLEDAIQSYLNNVNYDRAYVSYIAVGGILQNNDSIDSVVNMTINGGKVDVPLAEEEIATIGATDWQVL